MKVISVTLSGLVLAVMICTGLRAQNLPQARMETALTGERYSQYQRRDSPRWLH